MNPSRTFRIVCFASLGLAASLCFATTPTSKVGTEKDLSVAALEQPIPADGEKREEFLWNAFSHAPEIAWFRHHTTQNWRAAYDRFSGVLVAKAREQGREWQVLEKCLQKVPGLKIDVGHTAYLPIGAYRATQGSMQVWVIFCLWEMEIEPGQSTPPMQNDSPPSLGHFRVFAFDLETGELAGFVTCG